MKASCKLWQGAANDVYRSTFANNVATTPQFPDQQTPVEIIPLFHDDVHQAPVAAENPIHTVVDWQIG